MSTQKPRHFQLSFLKAKIEIFKKVIYKSFFLTNILFLMTGSFK